MREKTIFTRLRFKSCYRRRQASPITILRHRKRGKASLTRSWKNRNGHGRSEETIERARTDLGAHFQPETDAVYSDTNFQLLGKVIEGVTGKPLHLVYEELFFRPLGLKHTWLVGHSDPKVMPSAAPADIFYNERVIRKFAQMGHTGLMVALFQPSKKGSCF